MQIKALYIFLSAYLVSYWMIFPMFTRPGTGYFKSVRACHISPFFWIPLMLIILGIMESL